MSRKGSGGLHVLDTGSSRRGGGKARAIVVADAVAIALLLFMGTPLEAVVAFTVFLSLAVALADLRAGIVALLAVFAFAAFLRVPGLGPWASGAANQGGGFGGPMAGRFNEVTAGWGDRQLLAPLTTEAPAPPTTEAPPVEAAAR